MSITATQYLAENLYDIRRATFTDETGRTRGIGEDGLALLLYLCDRTNSRAVFFMTARTMSDETGTTLRVVRRLLAGFEALGWIQRTGELVRYMGRGKPTPEYALTLVPGLWENARIGAQLVPLQVPTGAPKNSEKPNGGSVSSVGDETEPEPQPEPQPSHSTGTRSQRDTAAGAGGELREQIVRQCEQRRRETYPGIDRGGLARHWATKDRPNAVQAMREHPGADLETLVTATLALDSEYTPPAPPPAPRPPVCQVCQGKGEYSPMHSVWLVCKDCNPDGHARDVQQQVAAMHERNPARAAELADLLGHPRPDRSADLAATVSTVRKKHDLNHLIGNIQNAPK